MLRCVNGLPLDLLMVPRADRTSVLALWTGSLAKAAMALLTSSHANDNTLKLFR